MPLMPIPVDQKIGEAVPDRPFDLPVDHLDWLPSYQPRTGLRSGADGPDAGPLRSTANRDNTARRSRNRFAADAAPEHSPPSVRATGQKSDRRTQTSTPSQPAPGSLEHHFVITSPSGGQFQRMRDHGQSRDDGHLLPARRRSHCDALRQLLDRQGDLPQRPSCRRCSAARTGAGRPARLIASEKSRLAEARRGA